MKRAEICFVEKVNDQGAGAIQYVRMPDGYLVDCGYGPNSVERADFIRDAVNAAIEKRGGE
ncbi:hypothetical protein ACRQ5Q_24430 [Bradyrhizobium sp. PMVTL-01]|uniref:hypothetical protein n=1 Tax=Bradyrhizobium sp. PMVTL-01 TaxID=3434999 RepID=UPI003F6F0E57